MSLSVGSQGEPTDPWRFAGGGCCDVARLSAMHLYEPPGALDKRVSVLNRGAADPAPTLGLS